MGWEKQAIFIAGIITGALGLISIEIVWIIWLYRHRARHPKTPSNKIMSLGGMDGESHE